MSQALSQRILYSKHLQCTLLQYSVLYNIIAFEILSKSSCQGLNWDVVCIRVTTDKVFDKYLVKILTGYLSCTLWTIKQLESCWSFEPSSICCMYTSNKLHPGISHPILLWRPAFTQQCQQTKKIYFNEAAIY